MKNKNVKKVPLIKENNSFEPVYLKFNFSFISYDKNFTDEYKLQFLKRIRELSSVTYLELSSWTKERGIEIERIDIRKDIDSRFFEGNNRNFDDKKYAIFRLYTNNNPIVGRVIGRLINKVFYIFFIDIGGTLYKH